MLLLTYPDLRFLTAVALLLRLHDGNDNDWRRKCFLSRHAYLYVTVCYQRWSKYRARRHFGSDDVERQKRQSRWSSWRNSRRSRLIWKQDFYRMSHLNFVIVQSHLICVTYCLNNLPRFCLLSELVYLVDCHVSVFYVFTASSNNSNSNNNYKWSKKFDDRPHRLRAQIYRVKWWKALDSAIEEHTSKTHSIHLWTEWVLDMCSLISVANVIAALLTYQLPTMHCAVPIKSSYVTSYQWLILTYLLSCTVCEIWPSKWQRNKI